MESIKWKLVLAELSPITILKSYKSVLVGQAFAFFTPARSGDYVGRILFLEAGNKLKGLAQMAWASYAQLLITLFLEALVYLIICLFTLVKMGGALYCSCCLCHLFSSR